MYACDKLKGFFEVAPEAQTALDAYVLRWWLRKQPNKVPHTDHQGIGDFRWFLSFAFAVYGTLQLHVGNNKALSRR